MSNTLQNYLQSARLVSDQIDRRELAVILRELQKVFQQRVLGDVVEFGCYVGTTSVHLQHFLQAETSRRLWVYDSFAGLPEKTVADESPAGTQFIAGELKASKAALIKNFQLMNLPLPRIKKAWFSELTSKDVPEKIAFAFLDGDYYESVMQPLSLIESRLSSGAVILVDDYMNEALPGAQKAVREWAARRNLHIANEASLAIIRVP